MSYDVYFLDRVTGKTIELAEPHVLRGGTYQVEGTTEAWLNITYNYAGFFLQVLGAHGLHRIDNGAAAAAIPVLEHAIAQLNGEPDKNYWLPTEGNARQALVNLLALAKLVPGDAVISIG